MKFRDLFKGIADKPTPEKMTIPEENQKQMLEFFMRTSIPRRKAKMTAQKTERGDEKLKQEFTSGYQPKSKPKRVFLFGHNRTS
ncbi:MAG: hypothetical protein FWF37_03905 [Chloroflexi bacterium]|nr:hypothetical protein [Chloroflexota bacterium]